ncbi:cytochrome P450 monooxygenase [Amylocystis lapponica]|nr:cytochrome P450 monooxygenase [Amylocystis lapponica]
MVCGISSEPPGPPPIPFFGNVLQLWEEDQCKTFMRWGKPTQPVVIINSLHVAQDLLDKRGTIYSDRPNMILHVELMGWDCTVSHMHYGERFGEKQSLAQYKALQQREIRVMLSNMSETPNDFKAHIGRLVTGVLVEAGFGHTVTSMDDEYVRCAADAARATVEAASATSMTVDFFPSLKHLPIWMPGAGWKRRAAEMLDAPLECVQAQIASGTVKPSFTASLLEELSTNRMLTRRILTTCLQKAQEEIDRVIGRERLPDFDDRSSLPYLECLIKEVYRWHPVGPLGVPHRVMSDDQYRGYDIPAGRPSLQICGEWMTTSSKGGGGHDTRPWSVPDPEVFRPERCSEDPRNIVFGFGRRVCPGMQFADALIWLAVTNIIAVFDIRKACDAAGNEITPDASFEAGLVSPPKAFICDVRPRPRAGGVC